MSNYYFLKGGGEMGELTRAYDWSRSPVGVPSDWPQSLKTTLAMILTSKFPMFLWWGDDLIQFYNDAYRPSLGNNGKHPAALGQKGKDCWPEIWDIIYPLINQVRLTGEATWSEDQLIPIFRNGKIEDVYWTFGYSPICNETGKIEGVLVVCTESTEKVSSLLQLQENKNELEFAIEAAELGAWDLNPATNRFTANPRLKEWFGLQPDEEIELPTALGVMVKKDRQRVTDAIQYALNPVSGGHYDIIYTIIHPRSGEERIVRAKGKALFNESGGAIRFNGILQDITEQKRAEAVEVVARKKVEASEQQVRSIIESAPFPITVLTGREMRITFANKTAMSIWGKGGHVIGRTYTELLPEQQGQEIARQMERVYDTGTPMHVRGQRLNYPKDGVPNTYYFNYSLSPLYDASGRIYGVMSTGADVTDLHLAKQKVEETEKSFRNTILKAPVAMCILVGPEHVVELANDRIMELWGKRPDEMLGRPMFEGLSEARDQGFEQLLGHVYATGESYAAQDVPVTLPRDGQIKTVYVTFVFEAYREANGAISGILAVAMDVTEQAMARLRIEELVADRTKELAEANSSLQRSNAELGQFAYIASHDLQEPLRKVSTFAQMLEHSLGDIDQRSKGYLDKINSSAARMLTLIRDVLAYSQLSKGQEVYEPVRLQEVIDGIRGDFELLIEQKGARIEYANLPVIEAIPLQMSQLFGNLISNALKFSRPGIKPVIHITASLLEGADSGKYLLPTPYYKLEFRDNGIGFNQEHAGQIFHIFQRLHGKSEFAGTGIGLAMCKKITQNHHGEIYAEGNIDSGAVFTLILPEKQS
jgi:PAS domain S-box-containing protein